jgi:hypothetical protein
LIYKHNRNINILFEQIRDYNYFTYEEIIEFTYRYIEDLIKKKNSTHYEKKRWLILNRMYRDAFLSKEKVHLFKTCTGSGKSVTSVLWVKCIAKLSNKTTGFVVLSPEYENGTDEIERIITKHEFDVNYIRFEGKSRLCKHMETTINDKGIKVKDLVNSNISITGYCENECPDYSNCSYYYNCKKLIDPIEKGGIKNWIGVQHQISAFLPIYLFHTEECILVIDEDFSDAIKKHYIYKVPQLRQNKHFLELLLKELRLKRVKKDEPFRVFVETFIKIIDIFLEDLYTFLTPLRYDEILDLFDDIDTIKGIDDYALNLLEDKAFEYIINGKIKPFKFIYKEIGNFIDNYMLEDPINNENITDWVKSAFYKIQKKFQISFLYYDKFLLNDILERENVKKVIINDATSEKLILENLFRDAEKIVEHTEDWMYENCEFHQLKKVVNAKNNKYAFYPKSSFYYKNTFFFLMEDVKSILTKHKDDKVLIIAREIDQKHIPFAYMKLSDYISTLGHKSCTFMDYPLSGTNEFSDYDVVILLGKPELPEFVLKRQSILIGMEKEKYRTLYSKNNMLQGMGRIFRGSTHKYVYLLTGFDLELNRPLTTYKSHTDLQNNIKNFVKNKKVIEIKEGNVDKIFEFIKINKSIDIKECEKLLNFSNYKSRNFLISLFNEGKLKKRVGERGKRIFFL